MKVKMSRWVYINVLFISLIPLPLLAATKADLDSLFLLSLEDLLKVEVSVASKSKSQTIRSAPSVISIITEQDIHQTGSKTLEELLGRVVGFDVNPIPPEPNPSVAIRGISNSTNEIIRLLINNHPIGNLFTSGLGYWEGFPVNLIQRIEIIRGPGSALYGDAAMVGVINIITKDWNDASELSASYGSFSTTNVYGSSSEQSGDFSIYSFADYHSSDGDSNLVESDLATSLFGPMGSAAPGDTTEQYQYVNLFSKIKFREFYGMMMLNYNDTQIPMSLQRSLTSDNTRNLTNFFMEFGYDAPAYYCEDMKTRFYYDYFVYDFSSALFDSKTTAFLNQTLASNFPPGETLNIDPFLKNNKFGAEITCGQPFSEGGRLVLGLQSEYQEQFDSKFVVNANVTGQVITLDGIDYAPLEYVGGMRDVTNSYNFTQNESRYLTAVYGEVDLDIIEQWSLENIGTSLTLTVGGRIDEYSDVGDKFSPRVGVVYLPSSRYFIKALAGKAFRAPNFRELYNQNNPIQNGNTDVKPELLTTIEASIGLNITEWASYFFTVYSTKVDDHIRLVDAEQGVNKFNNIGTLEEEGLEAEIKIIFPNDPNTNGYLNFTYQKSKDVSHEIITDTLGSVYTQKSYDIGNIPETMINLGINWGVTENININASLNYKSDRMRSGKLQFTSATTDPDGTLEKFDQRDPIEYRVITNISVIYHGFDFHTDSELQLTVYNVFDAEDHAPDTEVGILNDIPRWGRHFSMRGLYRF